MLGGGGNRGAFFEGSSHSSWLRPVPAFPSVVLLLAVPRAVTLCCGLCLSCQVISSRSPQPLHLQTSSDQSSPFLLTSGCLKVEGLGSTFSPFT